MVVFGEVYFNFFWVVVVTTIVKLDNLLDVAVDVVDNGEAPGEDFLDELLDRLNLDLAVRVCSLYLWFREIATLLPSTYSVCRVSVSPARV